MTHTNQAAARNAPKLLSINEACQALRISRWSIYQLINQRRIKTVRVLGRHLIAPEDLDAFVAHLRDEEETAHA